MNQRIFGLDLLRATAIFMVLAAHYPKGESGGPLMRILNFGWAGVDLFFVLSGYLIGRQLLKTVANGQSIAVREFYLSRLMRTLPCYFVVLAAYLGLAAAGAMPAPAPLWQFASFTQNFGVPNTFTPSWSLCVEEHFYAIFPLAMLAFARYGRREDFVKGIAAILILEVAVRATLWTIIRPDLKDPTGALNSYMTFFYYPTYCRLDGITIGVGLAAVQHLYPATWRKLMVSGNQLLAASAFSFGGAVFALWQRYSFLCCTLGFTLLSVSFCFLTAASMSDNSVLTRVRIPGVALIASLSYSIYLTHSLAIEAASSAGQYGHISLQSVPGLVLVAAFLAVFATILYRGVELPCLGIRARLLGKPAKQPESMRLIPASEAR